jgi:acyl-CoA thioester hydrolase
MLVVPSGVTVTTHRVRVAYADTDQGGVVHHATYVRYLECARIEHMRERGFDYRRFELERRQGLLVAEINVRYKLPARFDEQLELETWIGVANRAKLRFDTLIKRDGALLTEAQVTLACVSFAQGRLNVVPAEVLAVADATVRNAVRDSARSSHKPGS